MHSWHLTHAPCWPLMSRRARATRPPKAICSDWVSFELLARRRGISGRSGAAQRAALNDAAVEASPGLLVGGARLALNVGTGAAGLDRSLPNEDAGVEADARALPIGRNGLEGECRGRIVTGRVVRRRSGSGDREARERNGVRSCARRHSHARSAAKRQMTKRRRRCRSGSGDREARGAQRESARARGGILTRARLRSADDKTPEAITFELPPSSLEAGSPPQSQRRLVTCRPFGRGRRGAAGRASDAE
jgi:hypothetical protein